MSPSSRPLVSVCIPAYNNEAYIGAAIESVLAQTLRNIELVVIDDRSTDLTRDVVKTFRDARLRFVENPENLGQEGNWNKALGVAQGRFVKILPGDDLLHPICLEREVAAFDESSHEAIVLVTCARDVIDETGRKILRRGFRKKKGWISGGDAIRECVRAGTNLIGEPAATLFPRSLIGPTGAFDGTHMYVIDLDYWSRLLQRGGLFVIDEPLCSFRISRTAASTRLRTSQRRDFCDWLGRLHSYPHLDLLARDLRLGSVRAMINMILRTALYRVAFSRHRGA